MWLFKSAVLQVQFSLSAQLYVKIYIWSFSVFENNASIKLAMHSKSERDSLITFIQSASSKYMKAQLSVLNNKLLKENQKFDLDISLWRQQKKILFGK